MEMCTVPYRYGSVRYCPGKGTGPVCGKLYEYGYVYGYGYGYEHEHGAWGGGRGVWMNELSSTTVWRIDTLLPPSAPQIKAPQKKRRLLRQQLNPGRGTNTSTLRIAVEQCVHAILAPIRLC